MNLPVYRMMISDDEQSDVEVDFMALVDRPAIQKDFLAFKDKALFAADDEQHIISGPAMLADTPIYRSDNNGEYYVVFEKDTIKQIVQKFFRKGYQSNVNAMHDPTLPLEDVWMFESFISDEKRGIQPMKGFEDAPDGSWFVSYKVDNEQAWAKVKDGTFKGFSVEGIFNYIKKEKTQEEEMMEQIKNILKEVI